MRFLQRYIRLNFELENTQQQQQQSRSTVQSIKAPQSPDGERLSERQSTNGEMDNQSDECSDLFEQ